MVSELSAVVGSDHDLADSESRARHARGKSTVDLLELRGGGPISAPDLVLSPGSHNEVLAVLGICSEHRIVAVVPFGGGTSVVGGLAPDRSFAGVIALDLRRMNALVELDDESRLAVLEPGLRGPEAEALLGTHGYTIGHFPQSFEYATLGGFAAARSSGQASAGYGRFDELVMSVRVATPAGTLELGRAPKSAAGPDLRQLVLGSEGAFGVITRLGVQLRAAPAERAYEGWRFDSFADGCDAFRRLVQDGPAPDRAAPLRRGRDGAQPRPARCARDGGEVGAPDAWPSSATRAHEDVERVAAVSAERLLGAGAEPVPGAGEGWAAGRYRGPYLRDALLDAGALVETLETATFWSALPGLYAEVGAALRDTLSDAGSPPAVLCHISHVYPAGASLYFTVACAQLEDPIAQWQAAKAAAGEAIVAAGASITHHHGVGADHRSLYPREVGALGVEVLRAVKGTLDPAGILNPGILLAAMTARRGRWTNRAT